MQAVADAAASTPATRPYLCHLISNTWFNFRVPELRAVAALAGVELTIDPAEEAALREESVFLQVRAADDASVARLATRTVMVRRFVDLWATGDSWEALAANVRALAPDVYEAYLAAGTTFKVRVEAFGRAFTEAEKVAQIERLGQLLPFRGKVRLKAPQHSFVLLCDVGARESEGSERPARYYFGREVASGQRELPGKYDLKKRNYIGTTSLDAELSLLMANLARVAPQALQPLPALSPALSPPPSPQARIGVCRPWCATRTAARRQRWWRRRTSAGACSAATSSRPCCTASCARGAAPAPRISPSSRASRRRSPSTTCRSRCTAPLEHGA